MFKKLILLGCLVNLSSCATTPKPEPQIQKVYCLTPEQYKKVIEAIPDTVGEQLTGNAQKDFVIAGNQAILLRVYANGLLQILGGCTAPAPSHDA